MKRFLALLCMVICTASLVGCNDGAVSVNSDRDNNQDEDMVNTPQGGDSDNGILSGIFEDESSDGMILTINGKDYDLTGHFNENIAEMVKDELIVVFPYANPPRTYGESGYQYSDVSFLDLTDEEKSNVLYAAQAEHMRVGPATTIYYINNFCDNALEFETINGITENFDADDICELEGFVPTIVGFTQRTGWDPEKDEYACAALYVDGELMDISSYEEEAESMLEEPSILLENFFLKEGEEALSTDTPEFFTHNLCHPNIVNRITETDNPKDNPQYEQYKNTLMLLLAERDVYWDMQEGKAEYMCLISYTYLEDEFAVAYQLYGTDYTPNREWKEHAE